MIGVVEVVATVSAGSVGALARWQADLWVKALLKSRRGSTGERAHGLSIAAINVVGSFAIGLIAATFIRHEHWMLPVLTTGFLGGFTTFSTAALDAWDWWRAGRYLHATVLLAATWVTAAVACALGVAAGLAIASTIT